MSVYSNHMLETRKHLSLEKIAAIFSNVKLYVMKFSNFHASCATVSRDIPINENSIQK